MRSWRSRESPRRRTAASTTLARPPRPSSAPRLPMLRLRPAPPLAPAPRVGSGARAAPCAGARRLHTILERIVEDISFHAPERAAAHSAAVGAGERLRVVIDAEGCASPPPAAPRGAQPRGVERGKTAEAAAAAQGAQSHRGHAAEGRPVTLHSVIGLDSPNHHHTFVGVLCTANGMPRSCHSCIGSRKGDLLLVLRQFQKRDKFFCFIICLYIGIISLCINEVLLIRLQN